MVRYRNRQCAAPGCGLRFPVVETRPWPELCPRCGGAAPLVDGPYESHEASDTDRDPGGVPLEALLDNVRSVRNVGSMFRTADGVGLRCMHLCGITPTPEHAQMAKTALGAERSVPWVHTRDGTTAASELRRRGVRLWALEAGPRSDALFALEPERLAGGPICLVVGHEVSGVDPRILEQCERILRLPMLGIKGSLNVSVAFGVALYVLRFGRGRAQSA